MKLLRKYIRELLIERSFVPEKDPDVPHGLSFSELRAHLSGHFGKAKITLTSSPLDLGQNYDPANGIMNKPAGLWYGCGTTWLDWLETMASGISTKETQIWSLKIDMSKVKSITSEKELQKFSYMSADHSKYSHHGPTTMDWNRASQKFSGIECCPYPVTTDTKAQMKFIWYFALDVASGCIWDASAITNSKLVAELKEDGWEIYI
jgi:hypothetical protein